MHTGELFYSPDHLDALMARAGLDVLVASSPHNVGYLIGHYRQPYFSAMEALGTSRNWPAFVHVRGRPDETLYVGNRIERETHEATPFWMPVVLEGWTAWEAADAVAAHLARCGHGSARIGFERPFLPVEVADRVAQALPHIETADATRLLHELRMVKRPAELALLRAGSEIVVDAIADTLLASGPGTTKRELTRRLRGNVEGRDARFGYALVTFGSSHNRSPFDVELAPGDVVSVDCGSDLLGYMADVTRMGALPADDGGEPDAELVDLLGAVETVQRVAFAAIAPGSTGRAFTAAADEALSRLPHRMAFSAHGMGLVAHEAPFVMTNRPVTYEGVDADLPLAPGMVLSVETTLKHPCGLVKLEDTLAVTAEGCEIYGGARGWLRVAA